MTREEIYDLKPGDILNLRNSLFSFIDVICLRNLKTNHIVHEEVHIKGQLGVVENVTIESLLRYSNPNIVIAAKELCKDCIALSTCRKGDHSLKCYIIKYGEIT